jgi:glycosyltransferase involved in cell wall biosynthesis
MITLSYIITTRNKLHLLRLVMARLLKQLQPDEEIVVVDGDSQDGTIQFLQQLYDCGKIHHFISEPDRGEAHGYNKGIFLAQGKLIKVITDDDVFFYPGIRICKEFMLAHPEIDLLATNGAVYDYWLAEPFTPISWSPQYREWMVNGEAFSFSGLGLMLRATSVAKIGLFQPGWAWTDAEYSMRVTSLGMANISWYTGYTFVRITNAQSNSVALGERVNLEGQILDWFYLGKEFEHIKRFERWIKSDASLISDDKIIKNDFSEEFTLAEKTLIEKQEQLKGHFLFSSASAINAQQMNKKLDQSRLFLEQHDLKIKNHKCFLSSMKGGK